MNLGTRIRKARKAKKLTLQGLADEMGVTKQLVWQWEHDQSDARKHIERLSQAMEMPVEHFYGPGRHEALETKINRLSPARQEFIQAMIDTLLRQQEDDPTPAAKKA